MSRKRKHEPVVIKEKEFLISKSLGFNIRYPQEVWDKIMCWVCSASPNEVSWFGTVLYDEKEKMFTVDEVYMVEQENSTGETTIDPAKLGKLIHQLGEEKAARLRMWGHSHGKGGVFWSSTDHEAMTMLSEHGYILATVFNEKGEMRSAYMDRYDLPFVGRSKLFDDEIPTKVHRTIPQEIWNKWTEEFKANFKEKKYVSGIFDYSSSKSENQSWNYSSPLDSWSRRNKNLDDAWVDFIGSISARARNELFIDAEGENLTPRTYWETQIRTDKFLNDYYQTLGAQ